MLGLLLSEFGAHSGSRSNPEITNHIVQGTAKKNKAPEGYLVCRFRNSELTQDHEVILKINTHMRPV